MSIGTLHPVVRLTLSIGGVDFGVLRCDPIDSDHAWLVFPPEWYDDDSVRPLTVSHCGGVNHCTCGEPQCPHIYALERLELIPKGGAR